MALHQETRVSKFEELGAKQQERARELLRMAGNDGVDRTYPHHRIAVMLSGEEPIGAVSFTRDAILRIGVKTGSNAGEDLFRHFAEARKENSFYAILSTESGKKFARRLEEKGLIVREAPRDDGNRLFFRIVRENLLG